MSLQVITIDCITKSPKQKPGAWDSDSATPCYLCESRGIARGLRGARGSLRGRRISKMRGFEYPARRLWLLVYATNAPENTVFRLRRPKTCLKEAGTATLRRVLVVSL